MTISPEIRQRLAEIAARASTATQGPWHPDKLNCYIWGPQGEMVADSEAHRLPDPAVVRARGFGAKLPIVENMAFISRARADVPWLLSLVETLRADLAAEKQSVAALETMVEGLDAKLLTIEAHTLERAAKACDRLACGKYNDVTYARDRGAVIECRDTIRALPLTAGVKK